MSLKGSKKESPKQEERCQFTGPSGRRCKLLRARGHDSFCLHHWRSEENLADRDAQTPEAKALVAELLGSGAQLNTTTAVNDNLSKLVMLRARKQISARDTALIAYILQLLIQTLHGARVEFGRLRDYAAWDQIVEKAIQDASSSGSDQTEEDDSPDLPRAESRGPKPKRKRRRKVPRTRREFAEDVSALVAPKCASSESAGSEKSAAEAQEPERV
jgi:hypothetical protein